MRTYVRREPGRPPVDLTVYIAYWLPGQASVSEVATHTPDACWPGGGWLPVPVAQTRVLIAAANQELSAAEYRQFKSQVYLQNVWYWHLYDRQPIPYLDPLSPRNLLEIALRYGFRRAGEFCVESVAHGTHSYSDQTRRIVAAGGRGPAAAVRVGCCVRADRSGDQLVVLRTQGCREALLTHAS